MRKNLLIKLILSAIIISNCSSGSDIKEIEGIWTGVGNRYLSAFIPKKKGDYCLQIKADEKKAYFYVEDSKNPIIVDINKIDDNEYVFLYKGKSQYLKFKKGDENYKTILFFSGYLNERKYNENRQFFDAIQFKDIKGFENTLPECLKYIDWIKDQQKQIENVGLEPY